MTRQELSQIHARFFNPPFYKIGYIPKHYKKRDILIWDSAKRGTFRGSVRDKFHLN